MADDDVPPLEDMSAQVRLMEKVSGAAAAGRLAKEAALKPSKSVSVGSSKENSITQARQATAAPQAKKEETFGGFKKGFLFAPEKRAAAAPKTQAPSTATATKSTSSTSTATTTASSTTTSSPAPAPAKALAIEEIPFIRPKDKDARPGVLPEIRDQIKEAMEGLAASGMPTGANNGWLTPDLVKKLASRPALVSGMANPRIAAALQEFQANQKSAMQKYKGDKEVEEFFRQYFEVVGEHFNQLADAQDKQRAEEKAKAEAEERERQETQRVLSNPEVVAALQHKGVQALLATLRSNPSANVAPLLRSTEMQHHVAVLQRAGLLAVARP
eukprot:m.88646 g.88646  ORF g.88646 m.88646 type:complete len:329 (-) comp15198_c1_seq1:2173-3159(-)